MNPSPEKLPFTDPLPSEKQSLAVQSSLVSRNITIRSHRTSVRLEPDMWEGLREICRREHTTMHGICTAIAERKAPNTSLTAAIRVFVMAYFRAASTEDGHMKAGHGPGGSFMSGQNPFTQIDSAHSACSSSDIFKRTGTTNR